jgi:hypothetical protein
MGALVREVMTLRSPITPLIGDAMNARHALLAIFAVALAGCANLSTVDRRSELPDGGKAVHLDAPQRIAFSNSKGWVCAEPSPDALQAYASSLGLGVTSPSANSASIAQSLSTSAGSIGLRTQSITLMRDALFRICELYYNDAISKDGAIQLLERSQDLTMGILAIEQLTGAVTAQQVVLTNSSAASAAAAINDTQKELDKAQADEAAKQTAADTAQTALEAQKKVVADKTTAWNTAKADPTAKATQADIDKLGPQIKSAEIDRDKAVSDQLAAKNSVPSLQAKATTLDGQAKTAKTKADDADTKATAADATYQAALTAVPKDQTKIDTLAAAKKTADDNKTTADAASKKAADDLTAANKAVTDAKTKAADNAPVTAAQQKLDLLNAQLKSDQANPKQAAADKAEADLKTATNDQTKKQAASDAAQKALKQAQANVQQIEQLGNTAKTNAATSTQGAGSFSTATNRYGVNKDTADALAKATTEIVQTVVWKGHLTDSCAVLLSNFASHPEIKGEAFDQIMLTCQKVIDATLQVYMEQAKNPGAGPVTKPAAIY